MGVHCQEQQQQKREKEMEKKTYSTECITLSVLFTCQYFTHKDFFNVSTLAAVSYFSKWTAKNVAELVTQEVSVTMVTFQIPKRLSCSVESLQSN